MAPFEYIINTENSSDENTRKKSFGKLDTHIKENANLYEKLNREYKVTREERSFDFFQKTIKYEEYQDKFIFIIPLFPIISGSLDKDNDIKVYISVNDSDNTTLELEIKAAKKVTYQGYYYRSLNVPLPRSLDKESCETVYDSTSRCLKVTINKLSIKKELEVKTV